MAEDRKPFDVFLSHSSADKAVVEALAHRLMDEAGLEPFLDKWHLVPGNPWQEELEKALDNSRTCAVFIGLTGIGPWENEEMRSALNTRVGQPGFRVVPVLLPGADMPDRGRLPRFLSRLTWVDFRGPEGVHDGNTFHRLVAGILGVAPGRDNHAATTPPVAECPYRGLEVFNEEHARFFFGREATTQHLAEVLRKANFLAVLGPSGSGKSSVVRAGLMPRLRLGALPSSAIWQYCTFKPGAHPLQELAVNLAFAKQQADVQGMLRNLEADERELHLQVRLLLKEQPDEGRICFLVDQFEEVFTLCQDHREREQFVDLLRYAATVAGGQTVVILTMRTDFVTRAAEYVPLAEVLSAHQFLISPMDQEDLRQAIEEPARLVGLKWEDGLVETILQDVGREPGMLPLMEDALFQLWAKCTENNVMTLHAYRDIGGVQGSLSQRANTLFERFSLEQQQIARRILLRLTQPGEGTEDTRRRATLQDLQTRAEEIEVIKAVVQTLVDARLLVTDDQQVDVAHEALIRSWPRLRGWIDDDRSGLRTHRRITEGTEEWQRLERSEDVLFRGTLLTQAQEWREQHEDDLNALERDFLDESVALKMREEKKSARWRKIGLVVIGIVIAVLLFALYQGKQTIKQTAIAKAALAKNLLQTEPAMGLMLAIEAMDLSQSLLLFDSS